MHYRVVGPGNGLEHCIGVETHGAEIVSALFQFEGASELDARDIVGSGGKSSGLSGRHDCVNSTAGKRRQRAERTGAAQCKCGRYRTPNITGPAHDIGRYVIGAGVDPKEDPVGRNLGIVAESRPFAENDLASFVLDPDTGIDLHILEHQRTACDEECRAVGLANGCLTGADNHAIVAWARGTVRGDFVRRTIEVDSVTDLGRVTGATRSPTFCGTQTIGGAGSGGAGFGDVASAGRGTTFGAVGKKGVSWAIAIGS